MLTAVIGLGLAVSAPLHAAPAPDRSGCDWPMYGHDPARTASTDCPAAPSAATVATLVPTWFHHDADVVTATPSVAGGVVYVGAWDGRFDALDLATGAVRWTTLLGRARPGRWADAHTGAYGLITSSAAIADIRGRRTVFVGGGGSMYALDASRDALPDDQRIRWRFDADPAHPTSHGEIESSPVVWKDAPGGPLVIFGSDANQDSGYAGEGVWAVRAETGALVWHFNPEPLTHHALFGCGNAWSSPALGSGPGGKTTVFIGMADCPDNGSGPCPAASTDPQCPPGQHYDSAHRWQQYSEAIVALSATTGKPVWSFQPHAPGNGADDDFGASAQLFALPDGRPVVGEGNKDGSYYVVDRTTGRSVWKRQEQGNGNVQPGFAIGGFLGATAVTRVAGRPRVFGASAIDTPVTYDRAGNPAPQRRPDMGAQPMRAFAASDGAPAWAAAQPPTYAAVAAGNGVVYSGAIDGVLRAYDASDGRLLWSFPLGAPISAGVAVAGSRLVAAAGTTETDLQFKACDKFSQPVKSACTATPLNITVNPLSKANGVWAFRLAVP
ncbi:MAG: hypothetical protein NVS1B12_03540 [Acidimicrobiales bacterium]